MSAKKATKLVPVFSKNVNAGKPSRVLIKPDGKWYDTIPEIDEDLLEV